MTFMSAPQGDSNHSRPGVLSGWKEIATYMGRGVRTVQRWEKLGLPVRRPNAHLRSAVLATVEDIDRWINDCGDGRYTAVPKKSQLDLLTAELENVRKENVELRREVEILKQYMQRIQSPSGGASQTSVQRAA